MLGILVDRIDLSPTPLARRVTGRVSLMNRQIDLLERKAPAMIGLRLRRLPPFFEQTERDQCSALGLGDDTAGLFNSLYYSYAYPAVRRALQARHVESSLDYFIQTGLAAGHVPCPFFDESWYRAQNGDVAEAISSGLVFSAFHHFLAYGADENRAPNPIFDESWYLSVYHDAAKAKQLGLVDNGFEFYCSKGATRGDWPSPYFNEDLYRRRLSASGPMAGTGEVANGFHHFLKGGYANWKDAAFGFDGDWYAKEYADVLQQDQTLNLNPYLHFVTLGESLGCRPSDDFDIDWYLTLSPEVSSLIERGLVPGPFAHYLSIGHKLGRSPHRGWNSAFYRKKNRDLDAAIASGDILDPLEHYRNNGRRENRVVHPLFGSTAQSIIESDTITPSAYRALTADEVDFLAKLNHDHPENYIRALNTLSNKFPKQEVYRAELALTYFTENRIGDAISMARLLDAPETAFAALIRRYILRHAGLWEKSDAHSIGLLKTLPRDNSPTIQITSGPPSQVLRDSMLDFVIEGNAFHPNYRITSILLSIGGIDLPFDHIGCFDPIRADTTDVALLDGREVHVHFEQSVFLKASDALAGSRSCSATLILSGIDESGLRRTWYEHIGIISEKQDEPQKNFAPNADVAICMATYHPKREHLRRQIDSILKQTFRDWVLIISDDSTDPAHRATIQSLADLDSRIIVLPKGPSLGFYRNFERALLAVSPTCKYVAFSDQDDIWHPRKLERLRQSLNDGGDLAFCDMRLVDEKSDVLESSFWSDRTPHWEDPLELLLANTVTGAASLFRRSLLERALPFPNVPHMYHDHWCGLVAASENGIRYIDEPLHDYVQHSGNVIGASGSNGLGASSWYATLPSRLERLSAEPSIGAKTIDLMTTISHQWGPELTRLQHILRVLNFRTTSAPPPDRLHPFIEGRAKSADPRLLRRTIGAEHRLIATSLARDWLAKHRDQVESHYIDQRVQSHANSLRDGFPFLSSIVDAQGTCDVGIDLVKKITPLNVNIVRSSPRRVNFLLPEINIGTFFGGYIGKMRIVERLIKCGFRVRLICLDMDSVSFHQCCPVEAAFPWVGPIFDSVEIVAAGDRSNSIDFSPDDSIVATTWWSAHVAEHLRKALGRARFLYLIQEYEPFTFPLGSYYSLAHSSYEFPHDALFSTALLADWFKSQRIGVFSRDVEPRKTAIFSNAILRFHTNDRKKADGGSKRLLFYGRPAAHAARNMYEVGLAALRQAIAENTFDHENWEFWAAGDSSKSVALGSGHTLRFLGKLDIAKYNQHLPSFDVGLALMFTPHPSLVPLEMAAAGLIVVTSECLTKTADRILELSPNFEPASGTPASVAAALARAVARCRVDKPRLNDVAWPQDWDTALDGEITEFLQTSLL